MHLTFTDCFLAGLTIAVATALAVSIGLLSFRARRPHPWLASLVAGGVFSVWLGAIAALAASGFLSDANAIPPRVPIIALTAVAALVVASQTRALKVLQTVTPLWLPVVAQSFRILVEIAFILYWHDGQAPVQVTFEGWNFDIFAGLTAPVIALGITRKRIPPVGIILWNLLGIALLGTAVFSVVTSAPGPLRLNWPGEPFTAIASWPLVWIPGLLAPIALALHIISIQQAWGDATKLGMGNAH